MFKIEGTLNGKKCSIEWNQSILKGDKSLVKKATEKNKEDFGRLGFYPFVCERNYLSEEIPAFCLIYDNVFDTVDCMNSNWDQTYYGK